MRPHETMHERTMRGDEDGNTLRLRTLYVSSGYDESLFDDVNEQIGDPTQGTAAEGVEHDPSDDAPSDNGDQDDNDRKGAMEPLRLPQSTHSLLFTERFCSLPYFFAIFIVLLSYGCLFLVYLNNIGFNMGTGSFTEPDIPTNVTIDVRVAQYLSIFIALLMEEEIPTGLYLLRMVQRESFEQKLPGKSYKRFVFSAIARIVMGYTFLVNVLVILTQSTAVIDIFYDVLALQFIQQLDDIAFSLAKKDVLGKKIQRACTAQCFQIEFEKNKRRNKKMSIFLKALYILNFCGMFYNMILYCTKPQIEGHLQCDSITVGFGSQVWKEAWVNMPSEHYEKWALQYPYFKDTVAPDQNQKWTLVFSYFDGVYTNTKKQLWGRPIYREMKKLDSTPYEFVVPAEIKYCKALRAWVFTHEHIRKAKNDVDESGCNWLLRSEETDEYDIRNVGSNWKIWIGVVEETSVSYSCNECDDSKGAYTTDCNLHNGQCINRQCQCNNVDGERFLGTHCEIKLKESCETIIGEGSNETLSVVHYNDAAKNSDGTLDTVYRQYGRPVYYYFDENLDHTSIYLVYSGNRWFGTRLSLPELNITWEHVIENNIEFHSFWAKAYDKTMTFLVSDPTTEDTPVGVDFYWIEDQGEQFGPFGSLLPIQLHNQTGRGYWRCGGRSVH